MWLNGAVQDSSGNWTTENDYINKITPIKRRLSFSECDSESNLSFGEFPSTLSSSLANFKGITILDNAIVKSAKSDSGIGGLTPSETGKKNLSVSTKSTTSKSEAEFIKLQRKRFPSLLVLARPTLKTDGIKCNDRSALDAKLKSAAMLSPFEFTEWLTQHELIRSEQTCRIHPNQFLKLGKSF